MKLAKNAGCACGSGLLYKDICWLHSLGRPGREEPGREKCKEIETTRRLLKEHSTQTLTARHSEYEAIKTWSGKLPSLYFTQQENLGCPRWQNNIRPPKSSQGLSHFVQACCSAGAQNIQPGPDWIFHCYCEVLGKKSSILMVNMRSAYVRRAALTFPKTVANGCLSGLTVTCLQTGLPACIAARQCVSAPCGRWRQRPCFRWAACCSVAPRGDAPWCHAADVFLHHQHPSRAFHLTGPDHWT